VEDNSEFLGGDDGEMREEKFVVIPLGRFEEILLPLIHKISIVLLKEVGGRGKAFPNGGKEAVGQVPRWSEGNARFTPNPVDLIAPIWKLLDGVAENVHCDLVIILGWIFSDADCFQIPEIVHSFGGRKGILFLDLDGDEGHGEGLGRRRKGGDEAVVLGSGRKDGRDGMIQRMGRE
jgi:hypothetical protein